MVILFGSRANDEPDQDLGAIRPPEPAAGSSARSAPSSGADPADHYLSRRAFRLVSPAEVA
jgi:hypothetical protein